MNNFNPGYIEILNNFWLTNIFHKYYFKAIFTLDKNSAPKVIQNLKI